MSNPVDDYLGMRKTAAFPFGPKDFASGLRRGVEAAGSGFGGQVADSAVKAMGQGAGQMAVGAAAAGLGIAGMKVWRALRKRSDFKNMLEQNPDLAEFQEADPAKFNAHYNSLRAMIPAYAEDPIISGSLMRSMSMNPGTAGKVLMEGLESRSKTGPSFSAEAGPLKGQVRF